MLSTTVNGLLLALVTAVFWGLLPIALKLLLAALDAYTITWYRFAVSGVALGAWLAWRRRLPPPGSLGGRGLLLLAAALAGLVGNYVLYLFSLELTSPTAAQVLIQLAPIFLLFGGLVVFRERFAPLQWLGFFVLVAGLLLFFHDRGPEILRLGSAFGIGIALMVAAALSWAAYGLAQKQLLTRLGSGQILLLLYLGATPVLLLPADLGAVRGLEGLQLGLLAFCCANTPEPVVGQTGQSGSRARARHAAHRNAIRDHAKPLPESRQATCPSCKQIAGASGREGQ